METQHLFLFVLMPKGMALFWDILLPLLLRNAAIDRVAVNRCADEEGGIGEAERRNARIHGIRA